MKSIGMKLWAGMTALVIVVLILLWLFQIVFLEKFYLSMRISEVKKEAAAITQLFEENKLTEFESMADSFAFDNNLTLELFDSTGEVFYETSASSNGMQMQMMRNGERFEALETVLEGRAVTISLTHPRFGNEFIMIGLPVTISSTATGALLINMPLAPVEDTVTILKKQLIFITFILLFVAMLISYLISKAFIKPILEIKKVSEKMASGDFTDQINRISADEIGDLANTINDMGRELSKIEQLRKDFIANVSHELRTPLSLVKGYAETLRDVSGNDPIKRTKQLEIIIEESDRLSTIVDDILNLSQLQTGNLTLKLENFMLHKTVENVVKRYDLISEKTGIQILVQGLQDIKVFADEHKIEQVLYNLINNAVNHTQEGGSITLSMVEEKENVRIEVSDTGVGILEQDIRHVWDRYYKGEKNMGKTIVGTGLGLAIVKSIFEAHHVAYGVESKFGNGTTFWFELKK